jgi:hypothetical protein
MPEDRKDWLEKGLSLLPVSMQKWAKQWISFKHYSKREYEVMGFSYRKDVRGSGKLPFFEVCLREDATYSTLFHEIGHCYEWLTSEINAERFSIKYHGKDFPFQTLLFDFKVIEKVEKVERKVEEVNEEERHWQLAHKLSAEEYRKMLENKK